MSGHYFARQPVLDRQLRTFAYELLYRGNPLQNSAGEFDGDAATSEVMISSLVDVGIRDVVGDCPALINVTSSFLTGNLALPEEKDHIILEILEDVVPTPEIIKAVAELSDQGYRLALDDYQHEAKFEPLLEHVELVKLDIRALSREALIEHVGILSTYDCKLLAEKVETRDEYEFCRELGFDYFQGYFFCQPEQLQAQRPGVNHTSAVQLMARLQDEECGFDEIQQLISNDAALATRLLRFTNSPFCGLAKEVRSIRSALSMVGLNLVRRWSTLMLMTRLGEGKSSELIRVALIRGRMCELLGEGCKAHETSEYFTVGLFSVIDALFNQPLLQAIDSLPLNPEVKAAVANKAGPLGETLATVLAYERSPEKYAAEPSESAYRASVRWCDEVSSLT